MPEITFINEGKSIRVERGVTILDAARELGIKIEAPCGGVGTCGKCKVKVGDEYLLACHTQVTSDMTVITRSHEEENRTMKIVAGGQSLSYEIKPFITKVFDGTETKVLGGETELGVETGDTSSYIYGLAADIGTTTLVAAIMDLRTGREITSEQRLNPQTVYAQDVLARIHFAGTKDNLDTLQKVFIDELNSMVDVMTEREGIKREHIYEVVYSGNTAMIHLVCGVNPKPLGQYPYVSQVQGGEHRAAKDINVSPFGLIYIPPIISAFVGPDITSGVLASKLYDQKETTLFIDIGTNGEMVLAKDGVLAATSTAAGPAFEGMNIACGMRAGNGAVETFHIESDGNLEIHVIGDKTAVGICGSGLLDIVAELVRTGIVKKNGRFSDDPKAGTKDGKPAFFITDDVYLTQKDIRQVQLAKGAIRCGIETLLNNLGLNPSDVARVEIAGSFGYHLRESSLLDIGLLPPDFKDKVVFVGNTSQSGGAAFLLNIDFREKMTQVVKEIQKIELANDENFEKLFVKALGFT